MVIQADGSLPRRVEFAAGAADAPGLVLTMLSGAVVNDDLVDIDAFLGLATNDGRAGDS